MRAHEIQPRKLVIFDIDDTLVNTQTQVHVVRDGQISHSLNSHEFTHYKLQPNEEFDFGDFRDAREFFEKSKPIIPMINQLKNDIATGNRVVMVTARADFDDRELFLDTFRKYGVDMNRVHVYRAGNMVDKIQIEQKKKLIIRKLLDQHHYTKAIMYDDAIPNLDSFLELKKEYPDTRFYAWHVSLDGDASEYHRTDESQESKSIVSESISPVVYHYTGILAARKILDSGQFELSSSLGSIETQYAPPGQPYFLSTTRSRRGGYHDMGFSRSHGVLFELDGEWYNRHNQGGPVDYWGNRNPTLDHHRKHEAEDRIYSRSPVISTGGVRSVHVLLDPEAEDRLRAWARQVLISAKRQGIPAYFYQNQTAWLNFDTRKSGDISKLTGQAPTDGYTRRNRAPGKSRKNRDKGYLFPWIELIQGKDKSQLGKKANEIRYNLSYTYDKQSAVQGLSNDLSNARKPDSGPDRENALHIIQFMQANKLNTVNELVNALAARWAEIDKPAIVTEPKSH